MKKKLKLFSILLLFIFSILYRENNKLSKTYIDYSSKKISKIFDNFKIVQISDLHDKLFGKNQKNIIQEIKKENPDIVVITGDIYYSYKDKIDNSLLFLREISRLYPVYFVTGNHEQRDENWKKHSKIIESYGVKIIDGKIEHITKNNEYIQIYGLQDPSFYNKKTRYKIFEQKLKSITKEIDKNKLAILLSHRPDKMNMYVNYDVDLVFSGHAHGGQIRIFGQGLLSPSEGFFPKYTGGRYDEGSTTMILSRGLGRTIFTTRLFNRPDIVVVTLKSE